jgi:hypothetical protein
VSCVSQLFSHEREVKVEMTMGKTERWKRDQDCNEEGVRTGKDWDGMGMEMELTTPQASQALSRAQDH